MATNDRDAFYESRRERLFNQRKDSFEIKYANLHDGQHPPTVRSRYGPARDRWLQNFAQIPREERTKAQWRKFERYHRTIYGTNDEWGDYD